MEEQSYTKHAKFVPLFHFVLLGIIVLTLAGSIYAFVRATNEGHGRLDAVLLIALSFAALLLFFFTRAFPVKVQDRVIRAEENMRHYVLAGKPLESRLTIQQIIGLRFASDAEFIALAQKAANENMDRDSIKKAVKNWRADNARA
jgi:uncharacterized membrane protein YbhN (UPF0104 family)